ncbi:flagellar biosynthetic protein FliR [Shimia aestuarii]|uniref:Flagellar biosynthetic protein FliR n=1 Tax=Shimia aestuarii TaxID=254406 RepID=A0A1I4K9H5_9RHOB|nr:flagellar biosynthetic protein FliR [Shimia aestuarii]SFL75462.1 flagellar biosynthetic protein FliR [Shimia aestuarii]
MIGQAQAFLNLSQDLAIHGFLVFLRLAAAVSILPAFGEMSVPARVKLGISVAFTGIVAPTVPISVEFLDLSALIVLIVAETLNGLLLGVAVRMFVFVLQTAGAIAAQSTSLSQLLGNTGGEPLPAIGHVLVVSGLALAVTTGLHVRIAAYFVASYDVLAFGKMPPATVLSQWGLAQVSSAFAMAFRLAAPFVIVSVLYNITLGVINRAMPQLMVAFIGAPAITAGGLALLALLSPVLLSVWLAALEDFLATPGMAP